MYVYVYCKCKWHILVLVVNISLQWLIDAADPGLDIDVHTRLAHDVRLDERHIHRVVNDHTQLEPAGELREE